MERMTYRENDIVYIKKDGDLLAPVNMSSFDIRKALERLADYEDAAEQQEKGCIKCAEKGCRNCRYRDTACPYRENRDTCKYYEPCNYCDKCGRKLK